MFNSNLKYRLELLERQHDSLRNNYWTLYADFQRLLMALNMYVEPESQVPRHIVKRPDPVAQECCNTAAPVSLPPVAWESHPAAPAKRRKKGKGKR